MVYLRISTGEVVEAAALRTAHPNVSFPAGEWSDELLAGLGYARVHEPSALPLLAPFERLEVGAPVLVGDRWELTYSAQSVVPSDPVEREIFISRQKTALKVGAGAVRYRLEVAGITLTDGTLIRTDRESQASLLGAVSLAQLNPGAVLDWKAATGWVQMTAPQIMAVAQQVGARVQALFSAERAHHAAIDALTTLEEVIAYDVNAGWPDAEGGGD